MQPYPPHAKLPGCDIAPIENAKGPTLRCLRSTHPLWIMWIMETERENHWVFPHLCGTSQRRMSSGFNDFPCYKNSGS